MAEPAPGSTAAASYGTDNSATPDKTRPPSSQCHGRRKRADAIPNSGCAPKANAL
ncbi:MAG: hypothetical protein ABTQ73_09165 [Caldilineales bacterium]